MIKKKFTKIKEKFCRKKRNAVTLISSISNWCEKIMLTEVTLYMCAYFFQKKCIMWRDRFKNKHTWLPWTNNLTP